MLLAPADSSLLQPLHGGTDFVVHSLPAKGIPGLAAGVFKLCAHPGTGGPQKDLIFLLLFAHHVRMETMNNIILIGPMGVGKTTIGRRLAVALGKTFVDSDREIEKRTGVDIPLIFDIEGEAGFRRRESRILDELTQRSGIVLATGGGAVLDPENRERFRRRGVVIYLYAAIDQLLQRTAHDRKRPLLQTEDPRGRLTAILAEREPLYNEIANLKVETGARSIGKTVQEILSRYKKADRGRS